MKLKKKLIQQTFIERLIFFPFIDKTLTLTFWPFETTSETLATRPSRRSYKSTKACFVESLKH